jgi:hypothetical protein
LPDCQEKIVRSSTFSSSTDYPQGDWLKTWLLAFALAGTLLLGWEAFLRSRGHQPTVVDDKALWALQRDRVYPDNGETAVVLLGDCRMQLDIVPQILRERFPHARIVQLAVEQTSPIAALRDLAADERFRGIIICAFNERLLCQDMWDTLQPYVDYYHAQYTLNEKLNRLLSTAAQRTFTVIHPELRLDDVIVSLAKTRRLPSPYYIEIHADRSRLADYSNEDLQAHRAWVLGRAQWLCTESELPGARQWLQEATELEPYVQAVQGRGGRVVFLRLPTTADHFTYDEFMFPKQMYWDRFAAQTSALCLHFKDLPQLSAFDCPDTAHLDRNDAPRFTRELAHALEDRGLFGAPGGTISGQRDAGEQTPCHRQGGVTCTDCAGPEDKPS